MGINGSSNNSNVKIVAIVVIVVVASGMVQDLLLSGGSCRLLAPRGIMIVCGVAPLMIRAIECSRWTVSNLMCDSKGLGQTTAHAVADWVKFWAQ